MELVESSRTFTEACQDLSLGQLVFFPFLVIPFLRHVLLDCFNFFVCFKPLGLVV